MGHPKNFLLRSKLEGDAGVIWTKTVQCQGGLEANLDSLIGTMAQTGTVCQDRQTIAAFLTWSENNTYYD